MEERFRSMDPPNAVANVKLAEAEFHAHRLTTLVDTKGAENEMWNMEQRVRARADLNRAVLRR